MHYCSIHGIRLVHLQEVVQQQQTKKQTKQNSIEMWTDIFSPSKYIQNCGKQSKSEQK